MMPARGRGAERKTPGDCGEPSLGAPLGMMGRNSRRSCDVKFLPSAGCGGGSWGSRGWCERHLPLCKQAQKAALVVPSVVTAPLVLRGPLQVLPSLLLLPRAHHVAAASLRCVSAPPGRDPGALTQAGRVEAVRPWARCWGARQLGFLIREAELGRRPTPPGPGGSQVTSCA